MSVYADFPLRARNTLLSNSTLFRDRAFRVTDLSLLDLPPSVLPPQEPQPITISSIDTIQAGTTMEGEKKRVHFPDDYTPSALSLRLTLGPQEHPRVVLKISVYFEIGKMPRIKIRTRKPRVREDVIGRGRKRRREEVSEGEEW